MGDSTVLQEIHLTAPEVTGVRTSRKEIEKKLQKFLGTARN